MKTTNVAEYEEVKAENPLTHEIVTVKIEKPVKRTPKEMAEHTKAELKKYGLQPIQSVEVEDPITGEKRMITLDRTGYSENNLIVALADPNLSQDRKDFMVSMYLYERGSHSASMMVDLMRYKGAHTKETRVFTSQMRFDFEMFANSMADFLQEQSEMIAYVLDKNLEEVMDKFDEWRKLPNNGKGSFKEFCKTAHDWTPNKISEVVLIEMAIRSRDKVTQLRKNIDNIRAARTRNKGKGIYLSSGNRPYTMDDPNLDEVIKADREASKNIQDDKDL